MVRTLNFKSSIQRSAINKSFERRWVATTMFYCTHGQQRAVVIPRSRPKLLGERFLLLRAMMYDMPRPSQKLPRPTLGRASAALSPGWKPYMWCAPVCERSPDEEALVRRTHSY